MEIKPDNFNMRYGSAISNQRHALSSIPSLSENSPAFTGLYSKLSKAGVGALEEIGERCQKAAVKKPFSKKAGELLSGTLEGSKTKFSQFIKENFTYGTDCHYTHREMILSELRHNFGDTFDDCLSVIDRYNSMASTPKFGKAGDLFHGAFKTARGENKVFSYTQNAGDDIMTFHKDPFIKNICLNIKEFTVGTVLDICISGRELLKKANAKFGKGEHIASTKGRGNFFNKILDKRVAEKEARDAFYKLAGVFDQATNGVGDISKNHLSLDSVNLEGETVNTIKNNIKNLAKDSIGKASKKVGKYNTKTERAWNRLGTGLVSATFAATDFYNISMLQNDDPKQANASGKKRFAQDMRRQGLTAGITYVVLGAFQDKVNKSVLYAALSLGGVTLLSEVLSRVMGKIPLTPLSPEEAAKLAEEKEGKKAEEQPKEETKSTVSKEPELNKGEGDVFNIFTQKIQSQSPSFTSSSKEAPINQEEEPKKKKTGNVLAKIGKFALGGIGLSLGIGFLRSRNVFKIDDTIKSLSASYNNAIKKATSRRLIMTKDDVDGFLNYLSKNNFNEQHDELCRALSSIRKKGPMTGQAEIVQKFVPKKEINPNGLYYDLGYVESKGKKTIVNLLLYPFNTVNKLLQKGNNAVKTMFGIRPPKEEAKGIGKDTAVAFVEKYATKYKNALAKDDVYPFRKEMEDAFTRHFSEANSQNKNTSIAMISRFLITFISGYFFVNDYRNEVLIESKGKDVDRANATMRERIGHKVANFFLNSMFMDIFNTTFENIYLGSVVGATGVAMATEFTNESAVRASICTPTKRMSRDELIEYEQERLNEEGLKGDYYRTFMKLTGKKPLSEKAKN